MAKYNCKENDYIAKVTAANGFFDWETLWNVNQGLNRANPNILCEGDELEVPAKKVKEFSCQTDSRHVFKVPRCKLFLRVRVFGEAMKAIEDSDYELKVDKVAKPFSGKTKNGLIEHEIPADAETAVLIVRVKAGDTDPPPKSASGGDDKKDKAKAKEPEPVRGDVPVTWKLQIGRLDPIQEKAPDDQCVQGMQQRLNNLCLNTGIVDGVLGIRTKAAVAAFQDMYRVPTETEGKGTPGRNTQEKMYAVHDGPNPPPLPPPKKKTPPPPPPRKSPPPPPPRRSPPPPPPRRKPPPPPPPRKPPPPRPTSPHPTRPA